MNNKFSKDCSLKEVHNTNQIAYNNALNDLINVLEKSENLLYRLKGAESIIKKHKDNSSDLEHNIHNFLGDGQLYIELEEALPLLIKLYASSKTYNATRYMDMRASQI